jgi:DNA gyrase subunit B
LAYLNKGLTLVLNDARPDENGKTKSETFHSEGGLGEFVTYLDKSRTSIITKPIHVFGKEDNIEVEVAMQYNTSYTENIFSYVNNINTREGGTHVRGFRMAIARLFKQYGEDNGFFKKLKFAVSGEDFREGLTAIVSVKVPEPQFKGQTKGELGNSEVTSIVSQIVGEALKHFWKKIRQRQSVFLKRSFLLLPLVKPPERHEKWYSVKTSLQEVGFRQTRRLQ